MTTPSFGTWIHASACPLPKSNASPSRVPMSSPWQDQTARQPYSDAISIETRVETAHRAKNQRWRGAVKRVMNREKGPLPILSPGITLDRIQPGGRFGPNGEVRWETPGGQVWMDTFTLGNPDDDFQLTIPEIRMPANQYWPLHWHDCWIAVIVIEGTCMVGDWWMEPGDVMITAPGVEYGPLLNGPSGCQLFEIFAQDHLSPGGYSPEYHDH